MAKGKAKKIIKKTASKKTTKKINPSKKSVPKSKRSVSARVSSSKQVTDAQQVTQISILGSLRNPKVYIPILLIAAAALLFAFRGLFIAGTVNGQPITRMALDRSLEQKYGKQELSSLVTETLIMQEASRKNISVTDKDVNDALSQISSQLKEQNQTLDAALALRGMTKEEFIAQLKIQKIVEKILGSQIKVSDKEVQDYIDKNKESLPTNLSDEELKVQVRQQLEQQKLSDKAQAWIQALQKKAKVNYFISL